jgi:BirA family biotin operon repressor/biotin-[acetyl-CoA-carboxylase] ligase
MRTTIDGPTMIGRPIIRVASVTSTMDLADALARRGASSGTIVLADHQTAGRGRAGRTWEAQPGESLLLSVIHRTEHDPAMLGALSPLLGLAIASAVDPWLPGIARVKWPNDVLIGARKLAGVLVNSRLKPGQPGAGLVIGIGINVANTATSLPPNATSLAIETGEDIALESVLEAMLSELSRLLARFEAEDTSPLVSELETRLAFTGEWVTVEDANRSLSGFFRGVDRDGALLLETVDSGTLRIVAGDLTRGPRPTTATPPA